MEKVQIFDAQEASKVAKEYLAGMHLNAELVADGHNVVHRLANVYRTPDYRNKVGGVCFVCAAYDVFRFIDNFDDSGACFNAVCVRIHKRQASAESNVRPIAACGAYDGVRVRFRRIFQQSADRRIYFRRLRGLYADNFDDFRNGSRDCAFGAVDSKSRIYDQSAD